MKGDHAVFLLKNRGAHVVAYWACQKLGAIATPLNWRFSPGEARYCIEDAEGMVVVFEAASRAAVLGARDALPGVRPWVYVGDDAPPGTVAKDFASFKRPRRYELVGSLPKSPTGKLLRRRLLEST